MTKHNIKYTKEILEKIVNESQSFAEVLRKLNLKQSGGNHSHIRGKIKKYLINTTHFKKKVFFLLNGNNKREAESILCVATNGYRLKASMLRRAMIESNIDYKCNSCNNNGLWNGKKLVLEVNHKNRNFLDNRINNLEFLCPNCHSQYSLA